MATILFLYCGGYPWAALTRFSAPDGALKALETAQLEELTRPYFADANWFKTEWQA